MGGDHPSTMVQFFLGSEKNETKSAEAKRPMHDENEYIRIMFAGQSNEHVRVVSDVDKERFRIQYQAWAENGEQAQAGTPLTELKFMNTATIADLSYHRVMTVESLAALSDAALQNIGMGARDWKNKAEEYLRATAADSSVAVKVLAAENSALKIDLDAMKAQIKDLATRLEDERKAKK